MRNLIVLLLLAPIAEAGQSNFDAALDKVDSAGRSLMKVKCAHPAKASEEKIPNRHEDGVTDEIHKMRCGTMSLQFYVANYYKPAHELPMRLSITKKISQLPSEVNIGATDTSVLSTLGAPNSKVDNKLTYIVGEEGSDSITFLIKNGRVVEIDWSWDVD